MHLTRARLREEKSNKNRKRGADVEYRYAFHLGRKTADENH